MNAIGHSCHGSIARPRTAGRPRVLSLLEAGMLGLAILMLFAIAAAPRLAREREVGDVTTVRVQSADTLWSIAESHRLPGMSTDATVRAIRRLNGLSGSQVAEGQVLRVPDGEFSTVASR